MKASVARTVHYVSYGTPGGEYLPAHRAAIITEVNNDETDEVSLCVLNPSGMFFDRFVQHDEDKARGTWHWPERVDE